MSINQLGDKDRADYIESTGVAFARSKKLVQMSSVRGDKDAKKRKTIKTARRTR